MVEITNFAIVRIARSNIIELIQQSEVGFPPTQSYGNFT